MTVDIPTAAPAPGARVDCCTPGSVSLLEPAAATALAGLAKALADPIRVQILEVLRAHPTDVCQCELQPLFAISQPTLSHHLKKLRDAGLITVERRGSWAYYSVRPNALEALRTWLS